MADQVPSVQNINMKSLVQARARHTVTCGFASAGGMFKRRNGLYATTQSIEAGQRRAAVAAGSTMLYVRRFKKGICHKKVYGTLLPYRPAR
ncbi:hypothetical protein NPIL_638281 [Nephila pilipes]|uniref:Uncharacterized protein n=1 Tax=Nephila pilipes TaxID=299642 RepID=A0A8X6NQ02_NEPPI|nr:hypothetical protein NPIL_638281 [Nephila pilipes]